MTLRCPRCGRPVPWAGNPSRPFCSLTCQLVDLGEWLAERYRIPADPLPPDARPAAPPDSEDAPAAETGP